MLRSILRMAGFVVIPAMGIVSPLLALPALTRAHGGAAWTAVAIGQSLGLAVSVVVELGWGLDGSQRVARASQERAREYFAIAETTKLMVVPLALCLVLPTSALLNPGGSSLTMLSAAASMTTGLTTSWYFIGRGKPWVILTFDTLPRVLLVSLSALMLTRGAPAEMYPLVGIMLPSVVALGLTTWMAGVRSRHFRGLSIKRLIKYMVLQRHAVSGRLASALYISLPTALVSAASPASVPVFAAAERLMRMALAVLAAVPNALQGWVGKSPTTRGRWRRAKRAIWGCAGMGLLAGIGFAILLPFVASFVFAGVARIPQPLAWAAGGVVLIVCISRSTGNIGLVAVRRVPVVLVSAIGGAALGIPIIVLLAHLLGALGGMLGMLLAEVLVLVIQLYGLRDAGLRTGKGRRAARDTHGANKRVAIASS